MPACGSLPLEVSECARGHTGSSGGIGAVMERDSRLVWGDGEDLDDFLRRVDACRLTVGDESKAVGKALLGLGSRISVMDSLSEDDKKDVASLKAALRREFGNSVRWYQESFEKRRKKPEETYGMFLSVLFSLFRGAFPGTDTDAPVAKTLLKSRFLEGVSPTVSAQMRLMFPEVTVDKLPEYARRVDEALASSGSQQTPVQQVAEQGVDEGGEIAQLRGEVAELSRLVQAIQTGGPPGLPARPPRGGPAAGAARGGVTSPRGPGGVQCWTCGAHGHVQGECRSARGGPPAARREDRVGHVGPAARLGICRGNVSGHQLAAVEAARRRFPVGDVMSSVILSTIVR